MQTRLSRTAEKRTKKQLILSILGIILLLFLLFKFGIPLLTSFSLFLSGNKGTTSQDIAKSQAVLTAPILNQTFSATNSASITVTGTAVAKEGIQLFVNDNLVDTTTTKDDGSFTFNSVNLTQQQNTIKVKAKLDNKVSDFSDAWNITYIQKAPNLTLDTPSDGQTFPHDQSRIPVKGKTDPDVKVTINDLWAIVDSSGIYSYTLSLQNGDNHIKIVATDAAGNTTTKELTVHYNQ